MKKCAILGMLVLSFMCGCPNIEYPSNPTTVKIIEGLPPDSSILLEGPLSVLPPYTSEPGCAPGGERERASGGVFNWQATGTGPLEGYNRPISLPVQQVEVCTWPRPRVDPCDPPVQNLNNRILELLGRVPQGATC